MELSAADGFGEEVLVIANDRERLVAPCGIDCGVCELYIAGSRPELAAILASKGIPREKLPCKGCRNINGECPVIAGQCETFACVGERGVEFCFQCAQFPCEKLAPAADRADVLPHNTKVFNLCVIRRDGVAGFVRASVDAKKRYYQGKMVIGRGPQLPAP
jgi:hypothetical protein